MNQRSARGASSLPGEYFTSLDLFERERDTIFFERWNCLGRASELPEPGSFKLAEVAGEELVLVRDRSSKIRAFYNVCRHRGTRLCEQKSGQLSETLQCPYHAWTYGLDGTLLGAPNMREVEGFKLSEHPLRQVSCREWEGFLMVNLSASAESLDKDYEAVLARLESWGLGTLEVVERRTYSVEANWKLLFQNYSECYHCPALHPQLNRLTPYRNSTNDLEEGPILGGPMSLADGAETMSIDGLRCGPPLAGVPDENLSKVFYYIFFPTLFLSLHPDYVLTHRLEPQAPAQTRVICEWLAVPGSGFDSSRAVEFWDLTNSQDWHVCELSQKGVSSKGYRPGPYSNLESMVAAFDREYLGALGRD